MKSDKVSGRYCNSSFRLSRKWDVFQLEVPQTLGTATHEGIGNDWRRCFVFAVKEIEFDDHICDCCRQAQQRCYRRLMLKK